eukprot:1156715-Pelagomonas_calceolata.AAC.2
MGAVGCLQLAMQVADEDPEDAQSCSKATRDEKLQATTFADTYTHALSPVMPIAVHSDAN